MIYDAKEDFSTLTLGERYAGAIHIKDRFDKLDAKTVGEFIGEFYSFITKREDILALKSSGAVLIVHREEDKDGKAIYKIDKKVISINETKLKEINEGYKTFNFTISLREVPDAYISIYGDTDSVGFGFESGFIGECNYFAPLNGYYTEMISVINTELEKIYKKITECREEN